MLIENVQLMNQTAKYHAGMDFIIINVDSQEKLLFWQKRLEESRGEIIKQNAKVLIVNEEFKKRAGNGLGTLAAFVQASKKCKSLYGQDLEELLKKGATVALYHAVGQGTRLYPITASEYGDKSAAKLPGTITAKDGTKQLMCLLEAVIKQTSIYAPFRRGRLSVFWGDQLFVPAKTIDYKPSHHIDLFVKQVPIPNKKEWEEKNWKQFGMCLHNSFGRIKLVEKCDYETFEKFLSLQKAGKIENYALSLGAFSLSLDLLLALINEFDEELTQKTTCLDSDLHFWMPITLDLEEYLFLMDKKGVEAKKAKEHYLRMEAFQQRFFPSHPELDTFTWVNTGRHSYWWDFGTVDSYFATLHKMTKANQESDALRMFFNIFQDENLAERQLIEKDASSTLRNCNIRGGRIRNSLLVGVSADYVDVQDCVIINSAFSSVQGMKNLIYHAIEETPLRLNQGQIRADLFLKPSEHLVFYSQKNHSVKENWKTAIGENPMSFEKVHTLTQKGKGEEAEKMFGKAKDAVETRLLEAFSTL